MNVVFSEKEKMMALTGFSEEFYVYCTTVLKYTKTTYVFHSRIGTNAYAVKLDKMYTDVSYITG